MREAKNSPSSASNVAVKKGKSEQEKAKLRKEKRSQDDDLPEVDQDAKKAQ